MTTSGERLDLGPIAVVGVSASKHKMGNTVYRELADRGYTVYPVHPELPNYEHGPCFATLCEVPDEIDLAVVLVKPEKALAVVDDAVEKRVKRLWFQQGADFSEAIARARDAGLHAIKGGCILMYAGPVSGIHKFHRVLSRLVGTYRQPHPLME